MATKDETGRGFGKRNVYVIYGENEMSARMLEVSLFCISRNGAPSRKRCLVNGRMVKANNKSVRFLPRASYMYQVLYRLGWRGLATTL